MIPNRKARVSELIKRQLGVILQQDLQDQFPAMISVTNVSVTKDLKQADIWVSVLGDENKKNQSMQMLLNEQKKIREMLAGGVKLRYVPSLRFHLDTSIEYNVHIDDILSRLKKEENWQN